MRSVSLQALPIGGLANRAAHAPALRFGCYAAYTLLFAGLLAYLCTHYRVNLLKDFFRDDHCIENIQLANLIGAAVIVLWSARVLFARGDDLRWPTLLVAMVFLWGVNREMDYFWESRDLDGVYRTLRFLLGTGAAAVLVLRFRTCWREYIKAAISIPLLLAYAAVVVWIGAEVAGFILDETLWRHMDRNHARAVKRVVEESVEMFAIFLMLFAAIEHAVVVSQRSRPEDPPPAKTA